MDNNGLLIRMTLAMPWRPGHVKWRPGRTSGSRCLAVPYIDARLIEERLDDVLGVENWKDAFDFLPSGEVVCTLSLRLTGEWVGKQGVGKPSKQPDQGDRVKAASTDAFKRAAVKWGIARYLYFLPGVWADYDPNSKQLKSAPSLPEWATPEGFARIWNERHSVGAKAPTSNGEPKWLKDAEDFLASNKLADKGEATRHVAPFLTDPDKARKELSIFGRIRLNRELEAQIERVGLQDWAEVITLLTPPLPPGTTITHISDQQVFSLIKILRDRPALVF